MDNPFQELARMLSGNVTEAEKADMEALGFFKFYRFTDGIPDAWICQSDSGEWTWTHDFIDGELGPYATPEEAISAITEWHDSLDPCIARQCAQCQGTGRYEVRLFDELINNGICGHCNGCGNGNPTATPHHSLYLRASDATPLPGTIKQHKRP